MKQHKFDIIMDYIDENIKSDTETIKKGIYNLYGITSKSFGEVLKFFTGDTLGLYIHKRKLYYAAIDLQVEKEKEIMDILINLVLHGQLQHNMVFHLENYEKIQQRVW